MYKFTIFICDDEKIVIDGLVSTLSRKFPGVKIESFFSPDALLDRLDEESDCVDVLILDHYFDGSMTGVEAIPEIRYYCPNLPIIILTGEYRTEPFDGVVDYNVSFLNKPSTEAQIIYAIERSLKGTEKYKELTEVISKLSVELVDLRKMLLKTVDADLIEDDIDLDISWNLYKKQVIKTIEKYANNVEMKTIQGRIKEKYPALPQSDLLHIATGEYLRQNVSEDKIDYSPMLIAYGKSLESILFKLLKKLNVKNLEQNHSLKTLIDLCTTRGTLFRNQLVMKSLMFQFLKFRNRAAHKDGVTRTDLNAARMLLFELDRPADAIMDELNFVFSRF